MYQRGDVILVPFPFTDLSTSKRRPAIIISNEEVNTTGDVIIVMITSQDKRDTLQIEILPQNITPGLPKKSYVRCHRIATIEVSMIIVKIGTANSDLLDKVETKVHSLLLEDFPVQATTSVF